MGGKLDYKVNLTMSSKISAGSGKEHVVAFPEAGSETTTRKFEKICSLLESDVTVNPPSRIHDGLSRNEMLMPSPDIRELSQDKHRYKSLLTAVNSETKLIVNKSVKEEHCVTNTSMDFGGHSDDNGFYSANEDSLSDVVHTCSVSMDFISSGVTQTDCLINDALKEEFTEVHRFFCDMGLGYCTKTPDFDSHSKKALLENSKDPLLPSSSSTVTRVPAHGLTFPIQTDLKGEHRWYLVVPLFMAKEKFTRRQLIQITAMMFLGFVFVALILVWVLSPLLF